MKKKVGIIASSVATIAVCASMVVGSTYALFTSEDKVDISVTAGKVEVTATVDESSLALTSMGEVQEGKTWANGGTVGFNDQSVFTLNNITPGDKAEFDIKIANTSTVNVKYRLSYTVNSGYLLASGLEVGVGGVDVSGKQTYRSAWEECEKANEVVAVSVHLTEGAGNIYQNLTTSISFSVEAIQANGVAVSGVAESTDLPDFTEAKNAYASGTLNLVSTFDEVKAALASENAYVMLTENLTMGANLSGLKGAVIDANGNEIIDNASGCKNINGENVEIRNAVFNKYKAWGVCTDGVSYYNCTFNDFSPYIVGSTPVVVDGCTFNGTILQFDRGALSLITVTNNEFNVSNNDEYAHAIVFAGDTKEFWEGGAKGLTVKGNTFNAYNSSEMYNAFYIYTGATLENAPAFSNNNFNGKAYYTFNKFNSDDKKTIRLYENVGTIDMSDEEEALLVFCPQCYNEKTQENHTYHGFVETVKIDGGVMQIISNSAWKAYSGLDWANEYYVLSYDLDISNIPENTPVCLNAGTNKAWSQLNISYKKVDGKYYYAPALLTKDKTDFDVSGAAVQESVDGILHLEYTFKMVDGKVQSSLRVNGAEAAFANTEVDVGATLNPDITWCIYWPENGTGAVLGEISNFTFKAINK